MAAFNSQHWRPHIVSLAEEYFANADKSFVIYNERFVDVALKEYEARLPKLKKDIFGPQCPADSRIDHHKITALYLQVFSEKPIFRVSSIDSANQGAWAGIKLINEAFCFDLMTVMLEECLIPSSAKPFWTNITSRFSN